MNGLRRYLLITFVGSFLVISLERGVYFFTEKKLAFSPAMNLSLALVFGLAYVFGALISHRLADRFGERRILILSNVGQLLIHAAMGCWPTTWTLFLLDPLAAMLIGMQWPIIESYVSAGHGAQKQQRAIGAFNLSWSLAIPLNLALAGPLIEQMDSAFFFLPALLNGVMIIMLTMIPGRPTHLEENHPLQLQADERETLTHQLAAARWLMLLSYAAMFVLGPLMPEVFKRLGVGIESATGLSSMIDVARIGVFFLMAVFVFWRAKRLLIFLAMPLLPLCFFMALFGGSLPMVLVGEVGFDAASGAVYFASLYYAQAVRNAAVKAGGAHEALIGSGFAMGPLAGLVGLWLAERLGSEFTGTMLILGPLFLLGSAASLVSLFKLPPSPNQR